MAGYIGSKASVVTPGAERKKVFSITTTTTSLTGLVYTPGFVHVFHNGVRLVDGTDYTATNGTSITLTTAAQNGDEVVVISYATFQTSDTVSASAGGTFNNDVAINGDLTVDTNTLFVDAANNRVGVGTSSPFNDTGYTAIDIRGSTGGQINFGTTSTRYAQISSNATNGLVLNTTTAAPMLFFTDGNERARIDASGNVGIGTSSPRGGVDLANNTLVGVGNISGNANSGAYTISAGLDFANGGYLQLWGGSSANPNIIVFGTSSAERMRIDAAGRITAPNQARCVVSLNGGWRTFTAGLAYGVSDGGFPVNNGGFYNGGTVNGFYGIHVPVSGWYRFDMYVYSGNGTPGGARLLLMKNDAEEITFVQVPSATDSTTFISRMFYMSANDYVNYRVPPPGFSNFTAYHANNHTMLAISLEG